MIDLEKIFKGKRITQMGLGLLGRGVGDATFLARHGAELIVTDMKTEEDLGESLAQLTQFSNITFHLGGHREEDFKDRDLILKGAGVPLDSPFIRVAREHSVPVDMSASLFARIARIPMIGITGTRGKSTVTHLVERILTEAGYHVLLGGNVRGVSNLMLFDELTESSVGVFELDSWQCQGFGEARTLDALGVEQGPRSPEIAVFTTFMSDHLNYYKGDLDAYLRDKANIFLHQSASDTLIIGAQASPALKAYKKDIQAHVVVADKGTVPQSWNVPLEGEHNRYNVGVAVATARAFGVDDDVIRAAVEEVKSIAGRMERIAVLKNGVPVYNDTNATTPDATIAALRALDPDKKRRIVLIMGGANKDLDMSALPPVIEEHVKVCVLLEGTGTAMYVNTHPSRKVDLVTNDLVKAVEYARDQAGEGDVILFSPAFASFGMFKNEYDRGERFISVVRELV